MTNVEPTLALVSSYIILCFSFFFILTIIYVMCCRIRSRRDNPNIIVNFPAILPRSSGIDKNIIASLPVCRFSSLRSSRVGLVCAVCLSKFEDVDILHLLPKCRHAFHVSCIDAWLEMHSSCPLCRQRIEAGDIESFIPSSSFRNSSSRHESADMEFSDEEDQVGTNLSHGSSATDAECSSSAKRYDDDNTIISQDAENGRKFSTDSRSGDGRSDRMYLNSQMLGSISVDVEMER